MTNSPIERRVHLRIYRNFILSYCEKGKSQAVHQVSQVNNVSQGGLNFSSTHPLKEGDILLIDLKTPFITDPVHLEGVVLGCKEKIADMIYEVRLQFKDLAEPSVSVLKKIEKFAKNKG